MGRPRTHLRSIKFGSVPSLCRGMGHSGKLTNDPSKVTCATCRKIIAHRRLSAAVKRARALLKELED